MNTTIPTSQSDALVFFGATGDLAYKKIFPSLQAMVKRGNLNVPVIGVAKANWNLDQFKARAKDSLEKHGGLDPAAFAKLSCLLRYVDGDYKDPVTFQTLRKELKDAQRPAHYLAIPPVMFGAVVTQLVSKSLLVMTSRRRGSSTVFFSKHMRKNQSSVSIIISASGRSTT
jgi:glucose-6-phosphate 1-dehydrogenase